MAQYNAAPDENFAVIGGEGFVGQAIIQGLLAAYPNNLIASIGLTQRNFTPNYRFFRADITSLSSVVAALKASGATTIFHTASPHHDGSEEDFERINVKGTQAVIEACREVGVKKLVFTSTITVVFDGRALINIDERLPVVTKEAYDDPYVLTKMEAEKLVLQANGKDGLLTCSLRLSGIIGPGDRQAIPGFIGVYHAGQTSFQIGRNKNLFDFVHISNVVHAHLLAASRLSALLLPPSVFSTRIHPVRSTITRRTLPTSLTASSFLSSPPSEPPDADPPLPSNRNKYSQFSSPSEASTRVDGEVFYITNGEPIPFWSLARAIWWEYAGHVPNFVVPLPVGLGLAVARLTESWAGIMSWITGKKVTSALAVQHVQFVGSFLYFDIEKARRVLGYEPIVSLEEAIRDSVRWAKEQEVIHAATNKKSC